MVYCAGVSVPSLLMSEYILHWFSPSAEVTLLASQYLLVLIPGGFGRFVNQVLSRFCEAQNVAVPSLLVYISSCLGVGLLCTLLVNGPFNFGGLGAAMSLSIGNVAMPFLTIAIMLTKSDLRKTKFWRVRWSRLFDIQVLRCVSRLVLLSMLTSFVAWLADEVGQFFSGRLGTTELGAQTVVSSFNQFFFCIPVGLGIVIQSYFS